MAEGREKLKYNQLVKNLEQQIRHNQKQALKSKRSKKYSPRSKAMNTTYGSISHVSSSQSVDKRTNSSKRKRAKDTSPFQGSSLPKLDKVFALDVENAANIFNQ